MSRKEEHQVIDPQCKMSLIWKSLKTRGGMVVRLV